MLRKLFFGFIAVLVIYSCLDPYTLDIEGYDNLLVVDGLITDENKPHAIVLRRTTLSIDEDSPFETGAIVYVTNNNGENYYFTEFSAGVYTSDSTTLIVMEGDKYTLHIQTQDGANYRSDECEVLPKTTIDKVYYKKDKDWDVFEEYLLDGLSFYIDGGSENSSSYVRLLFDEDWKFRTRYPERLIILEDGKIEYIIPLENWVCWKHDSSKDINVFSLSGIVGSEIKEQKVSFVASALSDRLSLCYCLGVRLLTISKEEYEYWRKLKESTEAVGDVFGKQPFSITGNIYNVANESETVLGFFQVGSVTSKRLYVNEKELDELSLPLYSESCGLDSFMLEDYNYSLYEIYNTEVVNGDKYLNDIIYDRLGLSIKGLYLSESECSDCSVTGNPKMPDFWEE